MKEILLKSILNLENLNYFLFKKKLKNVLKSVSIIKEFKVKINNYAPINLKGECEYKDMNYSTLLICVVIYYKKFKFNNYKNPKYTQENPNKKKINFH